MSISSHRPYRVTLSKRYRDEIRRIDQRLLRKIDLIERAIARFKYGEAADIARFEEWAEAEKMSDWLGRPIEKHGDPEALSNVGKAAAGLLKAMLDLPALTQLELGELIEGTQYFPDVEPGIDFVHIAPDLRPIAAIVARLGWQADELSPKATAGQPRKYAKLILHLDYACTFTGVFEGENVRTGSKGKWGRLFGLCLEAAGIPDGDQPDLGKAIRSALRYFEARHTEMDHRFYTWCLKQGKN